MCMCVHIDVCLYSNSRERENFPRFLNSYKDCSLLFLDLDHRVPWIIKHSKKPSAMNRACSSNWVMLGSPLLFPSLHGWIFFFKNERKYIFTTNATCRLKRNCCKILEILKTSQHTVITLSKNISHTLPISRNAVSFHWWRSLSKICLCNHDGSQPSRLARHPGQPILTLRNT